MLAGVGTVRFHTACVLGLVGPTQQAYQGSLVLYTDGESGLACSKHSMAYQVSLVLNTAGVSGLIGFKHNRRTRTHGFSLGGHIGGLHTAPSPILVLSGLHAWVVPT